MFFYHRLTPEQYVINFGQLGIACDCLTGIYAQGGYVERSEGLDWLFVLANGVAK